MERIDLCYIWLKTRIDLDKHNCERLLIWIKYSSANKAEIKITYPEGSVPVQFYPDTSFTKLAWELTLPAIVLIELILIFILLGKVLNKSKQIPLTPSEEITNEDKTDKNSP